MTFDRSHAEWEELISASLRGDLTAAERARLDAHLDACAACRETLAAFVEQRRIVAGLRHVAPPSDLSARVRAGIAGGSTVGLPWYRRPPAIFAAVGGGLAVVAGVLLALVLLDGTPDEPQVGDATPSVSASIPETTTGPLPASPAPTATPSEATPAPTDPPAATPAPTPIPASPEPELYLALTGPIDNQALIVRDGSSDETLLEAGAPPGAPIAAELSPDEEWIAYIAPLGESGLNEIRALRIADVDESPVAVEETVVLAESVAGSRFLERMAWSADGEYLAFTVADAEDEDVDAWVFEPSSGEAWQLTDVGNAYAASWAGHPAGEGRPALWLSLADDRVVSYLGPVTDETGTRRESVDPADASLATAEGVFQPLVSPNGNLVLYWKGRMAKEGAEWLFAEAGAPYLGALEADGATLDRDAERPVFTDLTIGREAFTSAAITWGLDGDTFAVWAAQWAGSPQGEGGASYPDESRVYFGHATDPRHVTRTHAIDAADIPEDHRVVDVKVPGTGRHLLVTSAAPRAGVLDPPTARLALITRNTGDVADEVAILGAELEGWVGPAVVDSSPDAEAP